MTSTHQNPPSERTPRNVIAIAADLLFASRIRAAAQAAGVDALLLRKPDDVVAAAVERAPACIFIDLDARGFDPVALVGRLKADDATRRIPVVSFVSHVREDAIAAARAAGADLVLPRSAFVRQLPELLRGA